MSSSFEDNEGEETASQTTGLQRRTVTPMLVAHLVDDDEASESGDNGSNAPLAVAQTLRTLSTRCKFWASFSGCLVILFVVCVLPVMLLMGVQTPHAYTISMEFQQQFLVPHEQRSAPLTLRSIETLYGSYEERYILDPQIKSGMLSSYCRFDQTTYEVPWEGEDESYFSDENSTRWNETVVMDGALFCAWSWLAPPLGGLPLRIFEEVTTNFTAFINSNRTTSIRKDFQQRRIGVFEIGPIESTSDGDIILSSDQGVRLSSAAIGLLFGVTYGLFTVVFCVVRLHKLRRQHQ